MGFKNSGGTWKTPVLAIPSQSKNLNKINIIFIFILLYIYCLFIVEKISGIYRRQTITLSVAHYLFMVFQILINLLINLS
jgi:hypothetical protein